MQRATYEKDRGFAVAGVLLLGASFAVSCIAKELEAAEESKPIEFISASKFRHCDLHTEHSVPASESRIDVNVPSITGAQTVDKTHSVDARIEVPGNSAHPSPGLIAS